VWGGREGEWGVEGVLVVRYLFLHIILIAGRVSFVRFDSPLLVRFLLQVHPTIGPSPLCVREARQCDEGSVGVGVGGGVGGGREMQCNAEVCEGGDFIRAEQSLKRKCVDGRRSVQSSAL
jgi:hypothetical protein